MPLHEKQPMQDADGNPLETSTWTFQLADGSTILVPFKPREKLKARVPTGNGKDANGNYLLRRPFKRSDMPKSNKRQKKIVEPEIAKELVEPEILEAVTQPQAVVEQTKQDE